MPELRHPTLPPNQTIHVTEAAAVDHYLPAGWQRVEHTDDPPAEPVNPEPVDNGPLDLTKEN